jgi:hypothetical protein
MDGMSLLDVLRGVMLDPAEQAAYNADPSAYLERYGFEDVDPADLSEAFGLVADTLPPDQAQAGLSATAAPDGGSFGAVTSDFDGDVMADAGAEGQTIDALRAAEPEPIADVEADAPVPFGQGDIGVDDEVVTVPESTDADDTALGDDLAGGLGETVGEDEELGVDSLPGDDAFADVSFADDADSLDETGDAGDTGTVDDLDDGPADLDIGLF